MFCAGCAAGQRDSFRERLRLQELSRPSKPRASLKSRCAESEFWCSPTLLHDHTKALRKPGWAVGETQKRPATDSRTDTGNLLPRSARCIVTANGWRRVKNPWRFSLCLLKKKKKDASIALWVFCPKLCRLKAEPITKLKHNQQNRTFVHTRKHQR